MTLPIFLVGLVVLLVMVTAIWGAFFRGAGSGSGGGAPLSEAATRFQWVTKPAEITKNVDSQFVVRLDRMHVPSSTYQPYASAASMVGAVQPASVVLISLNGESADDETTIPASLGGGTAWEVTTDSAGLITIIVRGSEVADAKLTVVYLRGDGTPTTETADFA